MGFFKDITIKTCLDNVGHLFNNTLFNVSTSGAGIYLTGTCSAKSLLKGIASPTPWCKGLYFASAALGGVSCTASCLCLVSGYSCIGTLPVLTGSLAYCTAAGARGCNSLADCMDPAAGLTAKAVDTCIEIAVKGLV